MQLEDLLMKTGKWF